MDKKYIKNYKNTIIIFIALLTINLIYANELCNITYQKNLGDAGEIMNQTILNNQSETIENITYYITNWQTECSDKINKSLEPKFVCNQVYYFILKNNWIFNQSDLINLKNKIAEKVKLSNNLLVNYIQDYNNLCNRLGYSDSLPETNIPNLTIYLNPDTCNLDNNINFFNYKINFMKMKVDCDYINNWKLFFSFEGDKNYYLVGLRIWVIGTLIILIGILYLVRLNYKMNKKLKTK